MSHLQYFALCECLCLPFRTSQHANFITDRKLKFMDESCEFYIKYKTLTLEMC